MYRLPTSSLALCVLVLSCGSPAELDREAFPTADQTGYDDPVSPVGGAGMGGSIVNGNGGTTNGGQGGTVAGSGGTVNNTGGANVGGTTGGTGATNNGGTAQGGTSGSAQGGAGSEPAPGGCPSDITVLFNRPAGQGGCAGGGCHIAGGTSPDLVSPGVAERLLGVMSSCNARPYLGPDSFLAEKVSTMSPECGGEMPFFQGSALSAEDEQCIVDWATQMGGGG